jgi:uncharacterized protein with von Willebrand factor type A (vWA) domain
VRYPYGSLPENLAAFCAFLRQDYGFGPGPGELIDAARALRVTRIADIAAVRNALRPVLSANHDQATRFDEAFDRFFSARRRGAHLDAPPLSGAQTRETAGASERRPGPGHTSTHRLDDEWDLTTPGSASLLGVEDEETEDAGVEGPVLRAAYSSLQGEGTPPVLDPPNPAWREAAAAFVARMHAGRSRRWRPAVRGVRFDLRRTLRSSLHTGADVALPRWLARPHRRPRFVVLVDGSRSMGAHALPPLRIAVALAAVTLQVEAFTFSTDLVRITRSVRRAVAGRRQRLERLHSAWGGGTTIGACLSEFVRQYGQRLVARETVFVIASDGLDLGDPSRLRAAIAHMDRRSAGIVWLNPLIQTPGYEPIAAGMSAARPYITTFDWVADAAGLLKLGRTARIRG